jgi:hypothetical protein
LEAFRVGDGADLIRDSVRVVLQELIELEASERIGAARYERTDTRVTDRNGARPRLLSTQAGDVQLRIPKLRKGSFFPSILEPRRRIDQALYAVVMEAYVRGISTRAVDDLVEAMGVEAGISKSEVSRICAGLDEIGCDHLTWPQFGHRFCMNVGPTGVVIIPPGGCGVSSRMLAPPSFRSFLSVVGGKVGQGAVTGGAVRADPARQTARAALDPRACRASRCASPRGASGVGLGAAAAAQDLPATSSTGYRTLGGRDRQLADRRSGRAAQATAYRASGLAAPRR